MTKKKSKAQILKRREKKPVRGVPFTLFKWTLISLCGSGLIAAAGLAGLYFYISRDLPKIISLKDYTPSIVTSVFSDDGRKIGEFYNERRIVIPLSEMPDNLKNAVVAAEAPHPGDFFLPVLQGLAQGRQRGAEMVAYGAGAVESADPPGRDARPQEKEEDQKCSDPPGYRPTHRHGAFPACERRARCRFCRAVA